MSEPTGRTFSEEEHFAVLQAAVQRETADLTTERDELVKQLDTANGRIDVLEAEKASVTSERDTIKTEFESFKTDLEEKAKIAERKEDRIKAVKAANEQLPDDFYTAERAQRWAEMTDDVFNAYVADITAAKSTTTTSQVLETAAFTGGKTGGNANNGTSMVRGLLNYRFGAKT